MKISTKVGFSLLAGLFIIGLTSAVLVHSHITTTVVKIDNSTGSLLTNVKLDIEGKTITSTEIGIYHHVTYKIKNQNEGSVKFEANLDGQIITHEFGYVTHNMREDFLIYVLSSENIRTYGH